MTTPHAQSHAPPSARSSPAGALRGVAIGLALLAAAVLMLYYGSRLNKQEDQRRLGERRQRDLTSIKEGRGDETFIYDAEMLALIVADPDAAASATSLVFSNVDFSDQRFAEINRLERLQNLGVASSANVDALLAYMQGMPSIQRMWIKASPLSESGIGLLASLPNLKQIRFEQAVSAEHVELLETTLPEVKIDTPLSEQDESQ
jgi:hypothetical protein